MATLHAELQFDPNLRRKKAFSQHCADLIKENEELFAERMARECTRFDMRAEVEDESLEVYEVTLKGARGVAHVRYVYGAHYGCKDMGGSDQVSDDWEFTIRGEKLVFDLHLLDERVDEI